MIEYRKINYNDLRKDSFSSFRHDQKWNRQWMSAENGWVLQEIKGSRSWSAEKRIWIVQYINEQISNGGFSFGAFDCERILGFISVDGKIIDSYANLTMLFIDDDYKRMGIGRELFSKARSDAFSMGAKKLFISAIPSEETISFYFAMGCKDAETIISDFIDTENDRYLEIDC